MQHFVEPTRDTYRNIKHRKTSDILDREDKFITDRNVILHIESLIYFLDKCFVCKRCRKRLTRSKVDQPNPPLGLLEVFGPPCGINFRCECGAAASLRPYVVPDSQAKVETLAVGKPYQN
jgi:hypothetical protein